MNGKKRKEKRNELDCQNKNWDWLSYMYEGSYAANEINNIVNGLNPGVMSLVSKL